MACRPPRPGRVVAFDATVGTGVVRAESGEELPFHATRVSDGSRTIEPGARVVFEAGAGAAPGSWEATTIVRVG